MQAIGILIEPRKKTGVTTPDAAITGQDDLRSLVAECLSQNRAAQKRLYDRYAPGLFAVIRRYVDKQELAEEILNDAFYKIFTKLSLYSFEGAFEGWMRRIAVNLIADHFRKKIPDDAVYKVDVQDYHAFIGSDTIGKMAFKELLVVVHSLPDTQRTVFNLFVFENLSHKEIGGMLGITENNSRWYLNDARRRLKDKLSTGA